jgi:hypothetical protein
MNTRNLLFKINLKLFYLRLADACPVTHFVQLMAQLKGNVRRSFQHARAHRSGSVDRGHRRRLVTARMNIYVMSDDVSRSLPKLFSRLLKSRTYRYTSV